MMGCICRLPHCVCSCQCIKPPPGPDPDNGHTELPPGHQESHDVPPDLVASVIRSSSGFFSGTLSAVSTISGHISPPSVFTRVTRRAGRGEEGAPPPPYEAPPSYKAALQEQQAVAAMVRADTV